MSSPSKARIPVRASRAHPVSFFTAAAFASAAFAVACGGSTPPAAPPTAPPVATNAAAAVVTDVMPASAVGGDVASADAGAPKGTPAPLAEPTADPKALVDRMRAALTACYETGKKAAAEMADGRIVLNVGVGANGKASCVVATDGNGLTREVTECMVARAERESYPTGSVRAIAIPLAVTGGVVGLQAATKAPVLEKIEAEGVQGAGATIQKMLPDLRTCVRDGIAKDPTMKGVLYLNAKVGKSGDVVCAVATRAEVPSDVRACVVERISKVKFSPPKWGMASLSIPLKLVPSTT